MPPGVEIRWLPARLTIENISSVRLFLTVRHRRLDFASRCGLDRTPGVEAGSAFRVPLSATFLARSSSG